MWRIGLILIYYIGRFWGDAKRGKRYSGLESNSAYWNANQHESLYTGRTRIYSSVVIKEQKSSSFIVWFVVLISKLIFCMSSLNYKSQVADNYVQSNWKWSLWYSYEFARTKSLGPNQSSEWRGVSSVAFSTSLQYVVMPAGAQVLPSVSVPHSSFAGVAAEYHYCSFS
jgi:hypothetical protein